jgi:pyruvate dehydrogenase E1 component alpha subunit
MAVYHATLKHAAAARAGEGPQFIECKTQRVRGHFEGDQQKYRDPADIAAAAKADPMIKIEKDLADMQVSKAEIEKVQTDVAARVEKAIAAGRADPLPKFAEAFGDVYTPKTRH